MDVKQRHPLWDEYAFDDGTSFYVSPFSLKASLTFPQATGSCQGGILADEMGMGKTIETLSLILANYPCHDTSKTISGVPTARKCSFCDLVRHSFICAVIPMLHSHSGVKTTLVVAPMSLIAQWKQEIERFSSLKVGFLVGVAREWCHANDCPVHVYRCGCTTGIQNLPWTLSPSVIVMLWSRATAPWRLK